MTQPHISHQSIPQCLPDPPPRSNSSGGGWCRGPGGAAAPDALAWGRGANWVPGCQWVLVPTGCWVPARGCSSRRRVLKGHRAGEAPAGDAAPAPPVGDPDPPSPTPGSALGTPPPPRPPPQTAAEGSAGFAGTNPVPATRCPALPVTAGGVSPAKGPVGPRCLSFPVSQDNS